MRALGRFAILNSILLGVLAPLSNSAPQSARQAWRLVWSDEFDGATLDRTKWTFDIGARGWGNNELEYYTDRPENVRVEQGNLVIEARQEAFEGSRYTSARLKTEGLHEWNRGRFEARIKIPTGQGIWPAFWLLGASAGWPAGGEIDIMENIGSEPATVYGSLHGPAYSRTESFSLAHGRLADDYHVYAVEWYTDHIDWFLDDRLYATQSRASIEGEWVFNNPAFFVILNVAVGGNWPGNPDETSAFPQTMLVDYVRVYQNDVF